MSSKRLIFFVLISLLLVGVPLENAEKPTVFQTENISSVGENLEDYDLYLDYVDKNNVITTMQPGNNEETASLFGNGIEFQSDEMTSDLIVKGKSNCEVKVVVYLKWRASQNTSTAEASFKLYSGSEVVRQKPLTWAILKTLVLLVVVVHGNHIPFLSMLDVMVSLFPMAID